MVSAALAAEILRLHHAEHWPIGTLARQLGVHHSTVHRARLPTRRVSKSGRPERLFVCFVWFGRFVYRPEGVVQIVFRHLATEAFTGKDREGVVQPTPFPREHDLFDHVLRHREVLHRIQITGHSRGIESVDVDVDELRTEEAAQYPG